MHAYVNKYSNQNIIMKCVINSFAIDENKYASIVD